MLKWSFLCFNSRALPLVHSLATTEKNLAPFSQNPPVRYFYTWTRSPEPSLLQAEHSQLSWLLSLCQVTQALNHLWPFAGPAPLHPCHSFTGEPRTGPSTPGMTSPVGMVTCLTWPSGNTLPYTAQGAVGLQDHAAVTGSTYCPQGSPDRCLQSCFLTDQSPAQVWHGFIPLQVQDLASKHIFQCSARFRLGILSSALKTEFLNISQKDMLWFYCIMSVKILYLFISMNSL